MRSSLRLMALILCLLGGTVSPILFAEDKAQTIALTIDYGDGVQKKFVALGWKKEMTIAHKCMRYPEITTGMTD